MMVSGMSCVRRLDEIFMTWDKAGVSQEIFFRSLEKELGNGVDEALQIPKNLSRSCQEN
jgi:hypothetical protein